ncbi:type IV pili methyl-accepting chemotaxis transducer N-terminal domain-containing protein [Trinickia sp. YCB016]
MSPPAPVDVPFSPPFRQRLSTRVITLSTCVLALVLTMIGGTLWLSWKLEGAAAAINDAGSLRMRAGIIALALDDAAAGHAFKLSEQIAQVDATLVHLRRGDPARPLLLPGSRRIQEQFERVVRSWEQQLKPAIAADLSQRTAESRYLAEVRGFIDEANSLVSLIEHDNAQKTALLRMSQITLAALSCIGTVAIVYLLYLWFIMPVQRLQAGLSSIEARQFGVRLPVDTRDEFGHLAYGFNRMAEDLQAFYQDLEARVDAKTIELEAQNRELTTLYEMTAFLSLPHEADAMCRGFLTRLMHQFNADAGSVRIVSADDKRLHLIASEGFSNALAEVEHCLPAGTCTCGEAADNGVAIVHDMRRTPPPRPARLTRNCRDEGFVSVAAFGIAYQENQLGSFSLHFRRERPIPASERQLLETLGQHLGIALQYRRLVAVARQLAVAEERNLVAQGLHDSIAQGLNFLKMQLHLLDAAVTSGDLDETREIVPLLRGGLDESYDDVRELLLNFRSRLANGELKPAVLDTLARFERQSGLAVKLDYDEGGGPPLAPDLQLQVLFILQETLSNVRKHAEAQHVDVKIVNARDFLLVVEDDGQGYDPSEIAARGETHVGFHIMRERASRLNATLRLDSTPGRGARVELLLPASRRHAA